MCLCACVLSCSVVSNSLQSHELQPTKLLCPQDFPGRNTGAGCHFPLQGIVHIQRSNLHLLHWQADSLPQSHRGSFPHISNLIQINWFSSIQFNHSVMSDGLCGPPGSSVHGIFQAGILEQVAIFFSRGPSQPRDRTHVSCIGRRILYHLKPPKVTWLINGRVGL